MSKSKAKHGKHAKLSVTDNAAVSTVEGDDAIASSTDVDVLVDVADDDTDLPEDDEPRGAHATNAQAGSSDKDNSADGDDEDDEEGVGDDEIAVADDALFVEDGTISGAGAYADQEIVTTAPFDASYAGEGPAVGSGISPTPRLNENMTIAAASDAPLVIDGVELVKKHKNGKKIAAIVCGSIAGALALVYLVGTAIFSNWYFPGTRIGAIDASMRSTQEVSAALDAAVSNYQVSISGLNFSTHVDASNVGVKIDSEHIAQEMHYVLPAWQWPFLLAQTDHDLTGLFSTDYSANESLNKDLRDRVEKFNETAELPVNATIAYDPTKRQFVVVPEVKGTAINPAAVITKVTDAILSLETSVVLDDADLVQPAFISTDEILSTAAVNASNMVNVDIPLVMGGHDAGRINSDIIAAWVVMQNDGQVVLDTNAMDAYITQLAAGLNTVGSERTYTRPDGKVITVSGGVYGWEIDQDALRESIRNAVMSGTSQTIEVSCISQGDEYTGPGQKDWGNRYIDVDLSEQHVRMYDYDGTLIWESDCISGAPDGEHDTNTGVYWLNAKQTNAKLIGYDSYGNKIYESHVRYWMPFVGNAIGLHDADWQPGFGGYMYANGYGSHGCVNLPVSAAYELFLITEEGDCVVSHW